MTRDAPPPRRQAWRLKFVFKNFKFFGTVSFKRVPEWAAFEHQTEDFNQPLEVFINSAKTTSAAQYQGMASAIYASHALQRGATLDELIASSPSEDDPLTGRSVPADPVGAFLRLVKERVMLPPELRPAGPAAGAQPAAPGPAPSDSPEPEPPPTAA